ncbi:MAG: methyltransferase domain-containing protein [Holosporales bacterium]|nr:methyltransferase domain-containing protein [Holosporales bacterium]
MNFTDADSYEAHATIQHQCAIDLVDTCVLPTQQISSVLDVGCGTGFVSRALMARYGDAEYTLCDVSSEMVRFCKGRYPNAQVLLCDAETYDFNKRLSNSSAQTLESVVWDNSSEHYDLVISNLAIQWFHDFEAFILKMLRHTNCIVFSTLLKGSFSKFNCLLEGVFPASAYATREEISLVLKKHSVITSFVEKDYLQSFANPYMAALYFKNIGAHVQGSSRNAFVFKNNKKPVVLEYKTLFVRIEA